MYIRVKKMYKYKPKTPNEHVGLSSNPNCRDTNCHSQIFIFKPLNDLFNCKIYSILNSFQRN